MLILYCQPRLLARRMGWQVRSKPPSPSEVRISGFSAGSYTAEALEAEYRLLALRLCNSLLPGGSWLFGMSPTLLPSALLSML